MNWDKMIAELMALGMTQAQIASACGTTQGHVSDLHRGRRKAVRYELGERIVRLHGERSARESG